MKEVNHFSETIKATVERSMRIQAILKTHKGFEEEGNFDPWIFGT